MAPKSVNNFIRHALEQVGDKHRKGAEVSMKDADPDSWDSSELVEWSANQSGVTVNDGSWLQYRQLNRQGGDLSVDDALRTPGALVFTFSSDPMASRDRPTSAGVAISLGNGQVVTVTPGGQVEVVDASTREFTHASVMPGFDNARSMGPDDLDQLQDLMKEYGLPLPKPDLFDPDGDGVPMSPDEATERVAELNKEATRLREQAEHAEEYNDRRDADIEVAKAILEEREADELRQKEAVGRAARAEAEAAGDLFRNSPELRTAQDEMVTLQRRLGLPVPADDLIRPDGSQPVIPPVETDPAVIEQLKGELVITRAHVEQLVDDNRPAKEALDQRTAERKAAEALEQAATASVNEQKADIAEISGPREYDNAEAFLKVARQKEAEAEELIDRAADVQKRFDDYQKAHPDKPVTDLGEIEVRTSGAEAYAQGRRERAGELEDEAADREAESIRDERAGTERSELSDLRDERAEDLLKRADEAAARAADAQRQATEATAQAKEWAATADKRVEDASRLRAAGKTEDADILKSRAQRATDAAIEQQLRASELDRDVVAFNAQANTYRTEATQLAQQADLLDEEAATLSASATAADAEADKLQERAAAQDRIADDIDARIASGVATEMHIKDDVEGTDVTIQIPGRPPTENDLPQPKPASQPSSRNDTPDAPGDSEPAAAAASAQHVSMDDFEVPDQFVAAAAPTFDEPIESQQDFSQPEPEPDPVEAMFDSVGGDDFTTT